jgi:hypothetical protein
MKAIFSQKKRKKEAERRALAKAVSNEQLSIEQQLKDNFCMSGVQLSSFRNDDGSFSLF